MRPLTDFARDLLRDDGEKTGLGWSFTVSTWIHVGLLVALLFVPATRRQEEEKRVPVDLVRQVPPPQRPKEEIAPLRRPRTAPRPSPRTPRPPAAERAPSEAAPIPVPPAAPAVREAVPNRFGNAGRAGERVPQKIPPSGSGTGGGTSAGEPPPGPGRGAGTEPPRDLRSALSEFRRAIAQGPPGGGGSGGGGSGGKGGGISVSGLTPSGFGVGNLWFDSRDYDWTPYEMQIYWAILRAWYVRLYAMTEQFEKWGFARGDWTIEHQNQVRFTILRSGEVVGIAIESPADCPPLDESSADALREVVLPPLPGDSPRPEETVHVRFLVRGDIRHMRNDPLLRAAYYGY